MEEKFKRHLAFAAELLGLVARTSRSEKVTEFVRSLGFVLGHPREVTVNEIEKWKELAKELKEQVAAAATSGSAEAIDAVTTVAHVIAGWCDQVQSPKEVDFDNLVQRARSCLGLESKSKQVEIVPLLQDMGRSLHYPDWKNRDQFGKIAEFEDQLYRQIEYSLTRSTRQPAHAATLRWADYLLNSWVGNRDHHIDLEEGYAVFRHEKHTTALMLTLYNWPETKLVPEVDELVIASGIDLKHPEYTDYRNAACNLANMAHIMGWVPTEPPRLRLKILGRGWAERLMAERATAQENKEGKKQ
jgi:hypothetical protein